MHAHPNKKYRFQYVGYCCLLSFLAAKGALGGGAKDITRPQLVRVELDNEGKTITCIYDKPIVVDVARLEAAKRLQVGEGKSNISYHVHIPWASWNPFAYSRQFSLQLADPLDIQAIYTLDLQDMVHDTTAGNAPVLHKVAIGEEAPAQPDPNTYYIPLAKAANNAESQTPPVISHVSQVSEPAAHTAIPPDAPIRPGALSASAYTGHWYGQAYINNPGNFLPTKNNELYFFLHNPYTDHPLPCLQIYVKGCKNRKVQYGNLPLQFDNALALAQGSFQVLSKVKGYAITLNIAIVCAYGDPQLDGRHAAIVLHLQAENVPWLAKQWLDSTEGYILLTREARPSKDLLAAYQQSIDHHKFTGRWKCVTHGKL